MDFNILLFLCFEAPVSQCNSTKDKGLIQFTSNEDLEQQVHISHTQVQNAEDQKVLRRTSVENSYVDLKGYVFGISSSTSVRLLYICISVMQKKLATVEKKNNKKKSTLSQINIECSFGPKQKAIAQNAEWPKNHHSPTPYKSQHQLLSPAFCCHLRKDQRIWGKR